MDHRLFDFIHGLSGKFQALDQLMVFFTSNVKYVFVAAIALTFLYAFRNRVWGWVSIGMAASVAVGMGIGETLKTFFYRPRPFLESETVIPLIEHSTSSSFPSNHTIGAFSIAIIAFMLHRKLGGLLLILACGIAFSRIYVGHHFPLDVLTGILISLLSSMMVYWVITKVRRKYPNMLSPKT